MIIHNLDIARSARRPHEADPPLIVDPNAVPAGPLAFQSLQLVAGRHAKIGQQHGCVEHVELPHGYACDPAEPPTFAGAVQLLRLGAGE